MNNGERLVSALRWSGSEKDASRPAASLAGLLPVLGLTVLAIVAVIFAAAPRATPATVESGGLNARARSFNVVEGVHSGSNPTAGMSGNSPASGLEKALNDPVNGAWSSAEADWVACSGSRSLTSALRH